MAYPETAFILEDDDFDAAVTTELLQRCQDNPMTVRRVKVLKDALSTLSRSFFDVALVDLNVPDSDGLETIEEVLRINPHIPIIVLSGEENVDIALKALRLGAQDFLVKTEANQHVLNRSITYACQRKRKEQVLLTQAYRDALTGLSNRAHLFERWRRALARAKRHHSKLGVFILDLNRFKTVNDQHGHNIGDALLCHVAQQILDVVRVSDIVARLGGDEFVIIAEDTKDEEAIEIVRKRMIERISGSFKMDDLKIPYSVSVGCAIADPEVEDDLMSVLGVADRKMYEMKLKCHENDHDQTVQSSLVA